MHKPSTESLTVDFGKSSDEQEIPESEEIHMTTGHVNPWLDPLDAKISKTEFHGKGIETELSVPVEQRTLWKEHIKKLTAKAAVELGAIHGHDGKQWAASPGFQITEDEVKSFLLTDSELREKEVSISELKYILLEVGTDDSGMVYFNLKSQRNDKGEEFYATVCKTITMFVIARGTKDAEGGEVNSAVRTFSKSTFGMNF